MNLTSNLTSFSYLSEFSENDTGFMREMVDVFIEETPREIQKLQFALSKKDWKTIGSIAHSLKTSVRLMGMEEIHVDVEELEIMGKSKQNVKLIPERTAKIIKICEEAVVELKEKKKFL
ncbi:Hpt domain-containing protein [Flexithrix dorotheae]|uniref:Hpt domain-containing protein n=1 Tax=Flexithrix dorotheae TaxID=70993 RepID=UPI000367C1D3|nr:Hpt domain-containing protein [Flexithrix dorotheae]